MLGCIWLQVIANPTSPSCPDWSLSAPATAKSRSRPDSLIYRFPGHQRALALFLCGSIISARADLCGVSRPHSHSLHLCTFPKRKKAGPGPTSPRRAPGFTVIAPGLVICSFLTSHWPGCLLQSGWENVRILTHWLLL